MSFAQPLVSHSFIWMQVDFDSMFVGVLNLAPVGAFALKCQHSLND